MNIKINDFLELSIEDINRMPLKKLRFYLKKALPNYCQLIDIDVEIGTNYISKIVRTDVPAKLYRSDVDVQARKLLTTFIQAFNESENNSISDAAKVVLQTYSKKIDIKNNFSRNRKEVMIID